MFRPIIWLFNGAATALLRVVDIQPASEAQLAHSEEELRMIISASQEGGHIDEVEQAIMRRALIFGEHAVGEIMVPRTEMASLPTEMAIAQALEEVAMSNHTRYPVYEDDMDDTIGYVHVKDLYRADRSRSVRTLLRPIGFIAETASIELALKRFQSTRTPLAIVVDEHGGTAGLVTIQDVIEELIGEVQDEFDHEAPLVEELSEGSYSVDGAARLDYLEEAIDLRVPDEGFPTLGGRVFEQLQRRPRVGDEARVGNFEARILEVDGMRITRVLMTPAEPDCDRRGRGRLAEPVVRRQVPRRPATAARRAASAGQPEPAERLRRGPAFRVVAQGRVVLVENGVRLPDVLTRVGSGIDHRLARPSAPGARRRHERTLPAR